MSERMSLAREPDPQFTADLEQRLLSRLVDGITPHLPEEDLMTIELDTAIEHATPRRNWWLAAAAVIAVVGLGALLLRQNDDDNATGASRGVSFEVQWPDLRDSEGSKCFSEVDTDSELADAGNCLRTFFGVTEFTGDVQGIGLWSMIAGTGTSSDDDATVDLQAPFNVTYLVRGEVPGCGTGEFMIASPLQFVGWTVGEFVGTWSIVPNSGRGELKTISGSGIVQPEENDGGPSTHDGTISCE